MVLESMTYEEIASQMAADYPEACDKASMCFGHRQAYHRYVIKNLGSNQPHVFKPQTFTSKNHNSFTILYSVLGKSDYKKVGLTHHIYMTFLRKEGLYAVATNIEHDFFIIHTPHFFARYKERALKNMALTATESMADFFSKQANFNMGHTDNPKYKNSTFVVSNVGVYLAEHYSSNILIMKTFISFEMLKNQQIDDKELMMEIVKVSNQYVTELNIPELVQEKREKATNINYYGDLKIVNGVNDEQIKFSYIKGESHKDQIKKFYEDSLAMSFAINRDELKEALAPTLQGDYSKQAFYPIELITGSESHYIIIPRFDINVNHLTTTTFQYYQINDERYFMTNCDESMLKHNIFSQKLLEQYQRFHKELIDLSIEMVAVNFFIRLECIKPLQYIDKNKFVSDINFGKIYGMQIDENNDLYETYSK